jgi:hypothetical protein
MCAASFTSTPSTPPSERSRTRSTTGPAGRQSCLDRRFQGWRVLVLIDQHRCVTALQVAGGIGVGELTFVGIVQMKRRAPQFGHDPVASEALAAGARTDELDDRFLGQESVEAIVHPPGVRRRLVVSAHLPVPTHASNHCGRRITTRSDIATAGKRLRRQTLWRHLVSTSSRVLVDTPIVRSFTGAEGCRPPASTTSMSAHRRRAARRAGLSSPARLAHPRRCRRRRGWRRPAASARCCAG